MIIDSNVKSESDERIPLCVDLDGTLANTDLLFESLLTLIRQDPICLFAVPIWLLRGKAFLKSQIAQRVNIDGYRFPLNDDVVDYVREQRKVRQTVLVTGTHQKLAESIAADTELFDRVKGSDATVNLTNLRKKEWLVAEFGEKGFDYIGNDEDDLNVWPDARHAMIVSPENGLAASAGIAFTQIFECPPTRWQDYIKLIRVHQWSKNGLLLVPFFLDQSFGDYNTLIAIVIAFFAMSLLASATYVVNDMLDLQADRQNATKSKRMLASGNVSLENGFKAIGLLFIAVLVLTTFLPAAFNSMLLAYLAITLAYSFILKRIALIDVVTIAILHTLRVIAGTVVIQAAWSFWLLAFSMFVFFSLALSKRVAELINLQKSGKTRTVGRDYETADIPVLMASGVSTGYLSILVVALYINGEKVLQNYNYPVVLWLVCPILMYWIGRVWIKTARGQMHEDPIVFALRDRISRISVGVTIMVIALAMFL